MRVNAQQIQAFIQTITPFVSDDEKIELRLYGSRLDDTMHGGDIDLLIICDSEQSKEHFSMQKAAILGQLYLALDEENIDILILNKNTIKQDPFAKTAYESSQLIHSW